MYALDIRSGIGDKDSIFARLVVFSVFSTVAVFDIIPMVSAENAEKDMLVNATIEKMTVIQRLTGKRLTLTEDGMRQVRPLFLNSQVVYPNHESTSYEFGLVIKTDTDTIYYDAGIPERHRNDVRLSFKRVFAYSNIRIPGLGKYLKDNLYLTAESNYSTTKK